MLNTDRWALAFLNALGKDANAGLECIKAAALPLKEIKPVPFGWTAARRIEKLLRESIYPGELTFPGPENVIRFITLMIAKNRFRHIDAIILEIEKRLNAQKGVLVVTLESAVPVDSVLQDELEKQLCKQTGAVEIKMTIKINPELIAGYRLRTDGFYIDSSLRGQIEKMANELSGGMQADTAEE